MQPDRRAVLERLFVRDYTEVVECPLCGTRGGEFICLRLTAKATQSEKTFPVVAEMHLACFAAHFPMRLARQEGGDTLIIELRVPLEWPKSRP